MLISSSSVRHMLSVDVKLVVKVTFRKCKKYEIDSDFDQLART